MVYCRKCGKEIDEKAVVCPYCGEQTGEVEIKFPESNTLGILAIVFSIVNGVVGLIIALIGLSTYHEPENRKNCKIAIGIFCGWVVLFFLAIIIFFVIGIMAMP